MLAKEKIDQLEVRVYATRTEMGESAGRAVIETIKELHARKESLRLVFAAAPSQNEMLQYLLEHAGEVDWSRISAFHMDEYIGLEAGNPQLFSEFLKTKLFDHVPFREVNLINSANPDEADRYTRLLNEGIIDIVCLGIGENGHIAFNDPPVADFMDPEKVKAVELDAVCRQQQVNDGCFPTLNEVPEKALTLTIPALMSGSHLFCVVPGKTKTEAVRNTLFSKISTACPASVLRTHPACILFVDADSYPQ